MLKPTVVLLSAMLAAGAFVAQSAQLFAAKNGASNPTSAASAARDDARAEHRDARRTRDRHASCEVEPTNCPQFDGIGWDRNLEPYGESQFAYMRQRR
jgi:hypothetical protein